MFPYNQVMCHMWDREKEIVPVDDIYKQKLTSLLLMLEYLSAFFFKQCQNASQHHHYIERKNVENMALLTSNNTTQIIFHINGTKEW